MLNNFEETKVKKKKEKEKEPVELDDFPTSHGAAQRAQVGRRVAPAPGSMARWGRYFGALDRSR